LGDRLRRRHTQRGGKEAKQMPTSQQGRNIYCLPSFNSNAGGSARIAQSQFYRAWPTSDQISGGGGKKSRFRAFSSHRQRQFRPREIY
jgi:hypothetical protein